MVLGGLVLTSLDEPRTLARIFFWSTVAALVDIAVVGQQRGLQIQQATHLSGVLALVFAGMSLREGTEPPERD